MPDHEHHKKSLPSKENRKALNTPENAMKAVEAGRACLQSLQPGAVWKHKAPHGFEIKGALTLNNSPVVVINFSPEDGSVLPKGLHGYSEGTAEVIALIKNGLGDFPAKLSVLAGAEFREPESCWAVPLVVDGRIVAHIRVSSDGSNILPDKPAIDQIQKEGTF